MNPFLLLVLFLLYIPAAVLCLLAVLFRREQAQLRERERLSGQAQQVAEQGLKELESLRPQGQMDKTYFRVGRIYLGQEYWDEARQDRL